MADKKKPKVPAIVRKKKPHELLENTRPYLIEAIIPAYEVHILGGPSGAGKTRWLFQMLENWKAGNSIFGFKSHPVEYVYVSSDRSYASCCDTMRDLGIEPESIPILPAVDMENEAGYSVAWLMKQLKDHFPEAKFVIVEGIGTFVPAGKTNDYDVVAKFLRALGRMCRKRGITILGIHHTAKEKGKDMGYGNEREKLLGSAAWAAFSETIIMLDPVQSDDPKSPYRKMSVFPRNQTASFVVNYKFGESGSLMELAPTEKMPGKSKGGGRPKSEDVVASFEKFFKGLRDSGKEVFQMKELLVKANDLPRSTIVRHLEESLDEGTIIRVGRGVYKLPSLDNTFEGRML